MPAGERKEAPYNPKGEERVIQLLTSAGFS